MIIDYRSIDGKSEVMATADCDLLEMHAGDMGTLAERLRGCLLGSTPAGEWGDMAWGACYALAEAANAMDAEAAEWILDSGAPRDATALAMALARADAASAVLYVADMFAVAPDLRAVCDMARTVTAGARAALTAAE